jgi:hypothetical protein
LYATGEFWISPLSLHRLVKYLWLTSFRRFINKYCIQWTHHHAFKL